MKKQHNNTEFAKRSIHPDSYNTLGDIYSNFDLKDPYERERDLYLKLIKYADGLRQLSYDCWIAIDRACQERGKARWQIVSDLENRLETDPVVIAGWLASRAITLSEFNYRRKADEVLFKIDADFPAEAKIKEIYNPADPKPYQYSLPIPMSTRIKERIKEVTNPPKAAGYDSTTNRSYIEVTFGEEQSGWSDRGNWIKRIVYKAVYISGFDQIQKLITDHKPF